jgi:catechol 2,3-dioxygenase-like lactoylglutathione lyase family enzyme
MEVQQLGHVVRKVRDRERSERFYADALGLAIAARTDVPPMTFFTLGNSSVDIGPGDAYVTEPGHDAWVIGSEPVVGYEFDSQAAETYAQS